MNTNITKQFGIILVALAAIGNELLGNPADNTAPADTKEPGKTRGRPPKEAASGAAADGGAGDAPAKTAGKTYDELRAISAPLVEQQRGGEVKAIIVRLGAADLKALANMPEKHAEFIKDVEALLL